MNGRLKTIVLFAALLGFFVLTAPINHSEAEDAYYYARMAEQGMSSEMFHAHHLLYLPLTRIVFHAVQLTGYAGRAFPVLTGISMISGALAVCLFAALLRRTGMKNRVVWPFSAALLFSYGFWRYSTTVEIYAPAAALSLLTLYCAVRSNERLFFWGSVLSGSFALLLHLVTIPAVLLAVPFLYMLRRQNIRAAVYVAVVLLIAAAGYGLVIGCGLRPGVFTDTLVQRGTLMNPLTWISALVAWGQTVCSGNFLFSIPAVSERIVQLLPFHMLQEELFMGEQAARWVSAVAPVTFGLAVGLAAGIFCVVVRQCKRIRINQPATSVAVLLWFIGSAAMALCFEPANPETWICVLPPFWLSAGLVWNAVPDGRLSRWMPAALATVLLLHNWIGGVSLVGNLSGDYCRQKGAWVAEQVRSGDLILTADSHSFVTFLEYQTRARVADAKFINIEQWNELKRQTSGRIFVFADVMELLPPVARRAPDAVRQIHEVSSQLQPGLLLVHSDQFGTVYQWESL